MKFTSSEQLKEYREKAQKEISSVVENEIRIIVGMGTCGIAAGAREVMNTILEEVEKRDLQVNVIQTGCIGMCEQEPLVDVQRPGEGRITYAKVTPSDASRIVVEHVMHGDIVADKVIARFEQI